MGFSGMEGAHERVAQSAEHVTFNHGVVGSIPTALTNKIKGLFDAVERLRLPCPRCVRNRNARGRVLARLLSLKDLPASPPRALDHCSVAPQPYADCTLPVEQFVRFQG
jgi:hypothetical protein